MKDMIKRIREEREGFTLAELLIVVAIIAVLVAIAIPVFNSQLEKSREATDEANIRAIYAQLSADVLTEHAVADKDAAGIASAETYSVVKDTTSGNNVFTGTATYKMTQQTAGLANGESSVSIGGVTINSADFKTGTCTITVKSDGSKPTITIG